MGSRLSEMCMDLDLDFFGQDLGFFAGFGFEILQVPDLDLQIFIDNFANMLENVENKEMTHERNSFFECFAVIIHLSRL